MIRLIIFLIVAVALSWGATWLVDNPGRVSLTWQGTHIETSFVVLLLAVAVIGVLLVVLFEILRVVRQAPSRWSRVHRRARTDKGYAALSQGWSPPRRAMRRRPSCSTAGPTSCCTTRRRPCC
jgi:HemY protein